MLPHRYTAHLERRQAATNNTIPDYTLPFEYQDNIMHNMNVYLNALSIASAFSVLVIILLMRLYDKKLVDRVSLRLSLAISVTDLLSAISLEIYAFSNNITDGGCKGVAFLIIWLSNQYLFFSVAIAFNLQYLFLHKKFFNPAFEKWYFILSIGLSLLSAAIPLAADRFGFDEAQNACWYKPSYTTLSQSWEYGSYLIPNVICIVYCLVVVIMVAIKLKRDAAQMEKQMFRKPTNTSKGDKSDVDLRRQKTRQAINRVVRRILLYPIIPAITQLGFIISEIYMYVTGSPSYPLNLWGVPTSAIPGFCNFIAFLVDPALFNALSCVKQDLIAKYGDHPSIKVTDTSSATHSSTPQTGFMGWFVRTFLVASKRSDGTTFFMMSSYSDNKSQTTRAPPTPKIKRQSHLNPTINGSEETVVAIPAQAYESFAMKVFVETKIVDGDREEASWAEAGRRSVDMGDLDQHERDQHDNAAPTSEEEQMRAADRERQQAKKMMLGL